VCVGNKRATITYRTNHHAVLLYCSIFSILTSVVILSKWSRRSVQGLSHIMMLLVSTTMFQCGAERSVGDERSRSASQFQPKDFSFFRNIRVDVKQSTWTEDKLQAKVKPSNTSGWQFTDRCVIVKWWIETSEFASVVAWCVWLILSHCLFACLSLPISTYVSNVEAA